MLNPALKQHGPGVPPERQIVRVIETGQVDSGSNPMAAMRVTLNAMAQQGVRFAIITDGEPFVTHWWCLEMKTGEKQVYFGTPKSFELFQVTGKGHAYEFGEQGLVM